ncbi:hypothetical protein ACNQFZ_12730 [Schinkia sp. CFF1]
MRKYMISFSSLFIILFMAFHPSAQALFKDKEQTQLASLIKLNLEVHNSFDYGQGLPGYPTLEETIQYGNGHCGLYATYFAEKASKIGFHPIVVDLTSAINNENKLFHSVVELKIGEKDYTFDPTLGVYYKHNVTELFMSPLLAEKKVGKSINDNVKVYGTPMFWGNITNVKVYHDLDYYQSDYLQTQKFEVSTKSSFFNSPNDLGASFDGKAYDNYTASKEGELPVVFTIKFKSPVDVNRIYFAWYDLENYPTDFTVYDENGNPLIKKTNYKNNIGHFNEWLPESSKTDSLTFSFTKFEGQQRLLLRKLSVY